MNKYDIIIIGAGISGLSLAYYCSKEGIKALVIEKSERVGGALHSHHFEDIGFWIELGAHTCYNSYSNLIDILQDCSAMSRLIGRQKVPFKMLVNGNIKSIPSELNFIELLFSAPRFFTLKKEGKSVKEYYSKIIGPKNFDKVLLPALNAVISQDASDFPAELLFKKRPRRKDVIKKFTFSSGIQTITDFISKHKNIEIALRKEVISVEFNNNSFQVNTSAGDSYKSSSLAIATPSSVAEKLLSESFPKVSEVLSQIKVKKVDSIGVAVKADLIQLPPVAGIIAASDIFYSIVSRDTVKDNSYRGFTFHFKPNLVDTNTKIKRIADVLTVEQNKISHISVKENLVPSLKVGHDKLVKAIDQLIFKDRLLLTGNYFYGMAIEDCILRSLKEFLRLKNLFGSA